MADHETSKRGGKRANAGRPKKEMAKPAKQSTILSSKTGYRDGAFNNLKNRSFGEASTKEWEVVCNLAAALSENNVYFEHYYKNDASHPYARSPLYKPLSLYDSKLVQPFHPNHYPIELYAQVEEVIHPPEDEEIESRVPNLHLIEDLQSFQHKEFYAARRRLSVAAFDEDIAKKAKGYRPEHGVNSSHLLAVESRFENVFNGLSIPLKRDLSDALDILALEIFAAKEFIRSKTTLKRNIEQREKREEIIDTLAEHIDFSAPIKLIAAKLLLPINQAFKDASLKAISEQALIVELRKRAKTIKSAKLSEK